MTVISIIVFLLFCANTDGHICGNICQCVSNTITCREELPKELPNNVTDVILEGLDFSKYMHKNLFDHKSWRPVQRLVLTDAIVDKEILSKRKDYSIRKGLFNNLENLKHLKIQSQTYTHTEREGYSGLSNLESLDLSGCERHSLDGITIGLSDVQMPNLTILRLKSISSSTNNPISLNKAFFLALKNKPISELDLSYTSTNGMDHKAFSHSLKNLQVFKLEHAQYLLFNTIIALSDYQDAPTFSNIKELSANYATFPSGVFNLNTMSKPRTNSINKELILNLKVLSVRQIIPKGEKINITYQKFGDKLCPTIYFEKYSSLTWVVPTCHFGDNSDAIRLDLFDFGDNGLVYFDQLCFDMCRNMKVIDLSMNAIGDNINQIGNRAKTRPLNVIKLLLSHNDIKTLDNDILFWIPKLDVLDLSHNLLEHFSPFIPESHPLQLLDLSYNRISFIDPGILSKLGTQFPTESTYTSHTTENDTLSHRSINITGNMFQCTCDNKLFIEKLLESMTIIKSVSLMCFYETNIIPINESVLPMIEHLCTWPRKRSFIIVFSAIFIFICFIAIFVIVRRCRTRTKTRHFKMLLRKYKNDLNKPDYPVFLSFASADEHIVHSYVLPRLNKGLQELLETEEVCVATGDLNFLPGFTVTGEIIRCVEASRVVIFCVSREFCESGYCKNELVVADYTRTPVILLFLEEIEVTKMPKILQKYFYTTTRCKVTVYNGRRMLVPNWHTLCRSIVQLFDVQD